MTDCPADGERLAIEGKSIASARFGKDLLGYDYVSLLFSDGTVFRVEADGWCGSLRVIEPGEAK